MTVPEHSQLPWSIDEYGMLVDAHGNHVFTCTDVEEDGNPPANARLIVAAVNSRAGLLAEAKVAASIISQFLANAPADWCDLEFEYKSLSALKAAIKKAEESAP